MSVLAEIISHILEIVLFTYLLPVSSHQNVSLMGVRTVYVFFLIVLSVPDTVVAQEILTNDSILSPYFGEMSILPCIFILVQIVV